MADALGSVVVLISAAVIWLTEWEYKHYLDPLLSLVIVVLICVSTWPLFQESVLILLNSTPSSLNTSQLKSGLLSCIPVIRCGQLIELAIKNDELLSGTFMSFMSGSLLEGEYHCDQS